MISLLSACGPSPWPPLLIGLTGAAGSGKSTAAAYLADQYAFTSLAFAEPLLDMLATLAQHADVDGAWCVEPALKEQPMPVLGRSYRAMAQTLGTEWGRTLMGGLWLRIAEHKLGQARLRGENVVITDVRFPDEAAWLALQGGVLVRVERPDARPVRAHESETHSADLPAAFTLPNGSSRGALEHRIDTLIDTLRRAQAGTPEHTA